MSVSVEGESINGWTPPMFYDVGMGVTRIATQADINALMRTASAYGRLIDLFREAERDHVVMTNAIRADRGLDPL